MTPTDPSRLRAREAGLSTVRRATTWCVALTVVATGAAAGALGAALPGRSTHAGTGTSTSSGGTKSSAGSSGTTGVTGATGSTGSVGSSQAPIVQAPVATSSPS